MLIFGPVPSRRLGRSIGINNVPAKNCSYSCVYCQIGRTVRKSKKRQPFYAIKDIFENVKRKVYEATLSDEKVDYVTFVSDGEPTLDINLGKEIAAVKEIGFPIAVLTNASLIWRDDVRRDLLDADLVSLKVDAISEDLWRRIDRPHKDLKLKPILEGILKFTNEFKGRIITETMLLANIDYHGEFERIASFLKELKRLDKAYIAIPTRPTAEKWAKPAKEEIVNAAFQVFSKKLSGDRVEYLIGYEGDAFASTGKVEEDILSITAVHPMRETAIMKLLKKAGKNQSVVKRLLHEEKLMKLEYEGNNYYIRKLPASDFKYSVAGHD